MPCDGHPYSTLSPLSAFPQLADEAVESSDVRKPDQGIASVSVKRNEPINGFQPFHDEQQVKLVRAQRSSSRLRAEMAAPKLIDPTADGKLSVLQSFEQAECAAETVRGRCKMTERSLPFALRFAW